MNSSEYRQSFLDFFRERGHTIVPSSPLLPSAPNLLFTNAGMNQFVPYFLGERKAPWPRAADTQKCIRAGGKHNDLEDVGFDTYHHTFFEMLGNWSFGDYFKEEALAWSWELLTRVWEIPKERLYVTVYKPGPGDPAVADDEAYSIWSNILKADGLDPERHILTGGKADNFWMMGETGPCGPCSEIHLDCTEKGDTGGSLVNQDSAWCMEVWNNVFIQFNATSDGQYTPLQSKHVDTGLGFERIAGIAATTNGFVDFGELPSNYNSDLFTEFFEALADLTGHTYQATLPKNAEDLDPVARKDCGYRIIADHIRCLCCAIADGILPGNEGRQYVIRRILRRAVLWADRVGLKQGALESLVPLTVTKLGTVFPELKEQETVIRKVVASEEQAFHQTLDRGIQILEKLFDDYKHEIPGTEAFQLYDTYGFPLDLTQLMAREHGRSVDESGFREEMEKQKERARAAQKKETITVKGTSGSTSSTRFAGYQQQNLESYTSRVLDLVSEDEKTFIIFEATPFYPEMGGQIGDTGVVDLDGQMLSIVDTLQDPGGRILHLVDGGDPERIRQGQTARLSVDTERRMAIQRHHTATHLLNWALRETLGNHVRQAGSLVAPDHLRFDFNHFEALDLGQIQTIEDQVNQAILHNDRVLWYEVDMDQKPDDVIAVFGEKYGDRVRIVDIGAEIAIQENGELESRSRPGYSAELCGGTHVGATGEIGLFKILSEASISAGTRRIEAVAGESALSLFREDHEKIQSIAGLLSCPPDKIESRLQSLLESRKNLETQLRSVEQKDMANQGRELAETAMQSNDLQWVVAPVKVGSPNDLRGLAVQIMDQLIEGVVILGAPMGDKCTLVALVSKNAQDRGIVAGNLIRDLAGELGGKGGGKPDFAMGGGKKVDELQSVLENFRRNLIQGK